MLLTDSDLARYVGIALAVVGNALIGASFCVIKYATNRASGSRLQAEPLWWLGQAMMGVGEIGNFAAYGLAPPSIIAPLGATAVLVNQLGSSLVLREPMTASRVFGTLVLIGGSTLIVVAMPPKEGAEAGAEPDDVPAFGARMANLDFMLFVTTLLAMLVGLLVCEDRRNPRWPDNLMIYIGILSVVGTFTVTLTKCISIAFIDTFLEHRNQFIYPLTYVLLAIFVALLVFQVSMLGKALANFDTALVIPPYFVFFNISTIAASALLFGDFSDFTLSSSLFFSVGLALTFAGIYFLKRG